MKETNLRPSVFVPVTGTGSVVDQSWGWVVKFGGRRSAKIGNRNAAELFRAALVGGESWEAAWSRLNMNQWVRVKDGGTYATKG